MGFFVSRYQSLRRLQRTLVRHGCSHVIWNVCYWAAEDQQRISCREFAGLEVLKMWRLTMADNHTDQSTEVARARKTKISQESHIIHSACRSCVNSVKKVHECPGTYVSHRAAVAIFLRSDSLGLVPKNMRCSFKNTSCMHP